MAVVQIWNVSDSTQMRIFSYILIALGVLLFASAGYDEFRGSTRSPSGRYTGYSHYSITRQANPEEFRNAMTYHWFYASLLVIAGVIAYTIDKGQEKADPMSSDSDENIDEELRKDELDEEVKKRTKSINVSVKRSFKGSGIASGCSSPRWLGLPMKHDTVSFLDDRVH